jgi:hypothetical protein
MTRFHFRFMLCIAAAAAAWGLLAASPIRAGEDFWKAAESGSWHVGSRWLDGSTPTSADEVNFTHPGTYLVNFAEDPAAIQFEFNERSQRDLPAHQHRPVANHAPSQLRRPQNCLGVRRRNAHIG